MCLFPFYLTMQDFTYFLAWVQPFPSSLIVSLAFVYLPGWRLTKCQRQFQEASRFSSLGRFVPKCHPDGRYKDVQCYGSTCFCVDSNGQDLGLNRTLLPQVPDCPPTPGKKFELVFLRWEVQVS